MGCLCSKEAVTDEKIEEESTVKEPDLSKSDVQLVAPSNREEIDLELVRGGQDGSSRRVQRLASLANAGSVHNPSSHNSSREKSGGAAAERPASGHHQRVATVDMGQNGRGQQHHELVTSLPNGIEGEEIAAGWPSWLTSVAAEAIQGMVPRRAESFKKLKVVSSQSHVLLFTHTHTHTHTYISY